MHLHRSLAFALIRDEDGTTASEYAIMLVLICVALISAVTAVGNSTAQGWQNNVDQVTSACTRYN
jgi:Flp pilus assembly pilin Flp